jgi:hypothetical protein
VSAAFEALTECWYARNPNATGCPAGVISYLGAEASLPQYASETAANYLARYNDKWNIWAQAGSDQWISQLYWSVLPWANDVELIALDYNLGSGGDYVGNVPFIPPWYDDPTYWSQFVVSVQLTAPIGSGALDYSSLLSPSQLTNFQQIIKKFKSVDYVCREICVTLLPTGDNWDVGQLWDNGVYWDGHSAYVEHLPAVTT